MLTREQIKAGVFQRILRASAAYTDVLSEEDLARTRAEALAGRPVGDEVWVFAYGSLIWNPAFHFVERRVGLVRGYHRSFCLWTHLGRGSPERPGLVLGLERGGECQGVVFRIAPDAIEEELDIVWRREMVTAAYTPTWLEVATGKGSIRALAFVINERHTRYASGLADEHVAEVIATAVGTLGPCADYFFNTVAHLEELGMEDPLLRRLRAHVESLTSARPEAAPPDGGPTSS